MSARCRTQTRCRGPYIWRQHVRYRTDLVRWHGTYCCGRVGKTLRHSACIHATDSLWTTT